MAGETLQLLSKAPDLREAGARGPKRKHKAATIRACNQFVLLNNIKHANC